MAELHHNSELSLHTFVRLILCASIFSLMADKHMYDEVRRMRMRGFSANKLGINRSVNYSIYQITLIAHDIKPSFHLLLESQHNKTSFWRQHLLLKMSFQNDPPTISHFLYPTFRPDKDVKYESCAGKLGSPIMFGRSTSFLERNR